MGAWKKGPFFSLDGRTGPWGNKTGGVTCRMKLLQVRGRKRRAFLAEGSFCIDVGLLGVGKGGDGEKELQPLFFLFSSFPLLSCREEKNQTGFWGLKKILDWVLFLMCNSSKTNE